MGNRGGKIHRDDQTLGTRRWTNKTWIACVCSFKGRKREVFGPGYTELFFLDEPTALAAGHRPCFECRRLEAIAFQSAFSPGAPPNAAAMDARLHVERMEPRRPERPIQSLPDGAMIARGDVAFLVRDIKLWPWNFESYGEPIARPARGLETVLTPPSIVSALAQGFTPRFLAL